LTVGKTQSGAPLLISGGRDKHAIVWKLDLDDRKELLDSDNRPYDWVVGKPYKALHGHNHFVSCVAVHSSNNHFFSGSWDKTLRLWDLTKFTTHQRFQGHTKDVLSCALTCGDRLLVSGAMDNTVRIWDLAGNVQHSIEEFGGWVSSIKKIQNGKDTSLAIGSWDNTVGVYDSEYARNRTITNYDNAVTSMDVDSSGNFLFVGSKNGVINLWELSESEETKEKKSIDTGASLHALSLLVLKKDLESMILLQEKLLLNILLLEILLVFQLHGMPIKITSLLDALMEELEFIKLLINRYLRMDFINIIKIIYYFHIEIEMKKNIYQRFIWL